MWEVCFWVSLAALLYPYLGYPLILMLLGWVRRPAPLSWAQATPRVSLIVSAYNEEKVLGRKIANALSLDYPRDRLEILVASDGSTDRTCAIALQYERDGVVLYHHPERRGKNRVLNDVVPRARGEILVFTDANGMFSPNALRHLVRPFSDPRVGCVCGELLYRNPNQNPVAEGYNHYWRFDQWLKRLESRLHRLLGANGSIFAVRKELCEPLDPQVSNDMVLPVKVAARGYAVLYVPEALSVEAGSSGEGEELRRRSRIVARGLRGVFLLVPDLLRRRRFFLLFQLLSRKLLRYLFPLLLLSLFLSNCLLLGNPFYRFTLAAQLLPYPLVPVGYFLGRRGRGLRFLSLPYYFCLGNLAALLGLLRVLSFQELSMWEGFDRSYDLALGEEGRPRD